MPHKRIKFFTIKILVPFCSLNGEYFSNTKLCRNYCTVCGNSLLASVGKNITRLIDWFKAEHFFLSRNSLHTVKLAKWLSFAIVAI